MKYCIHEFTPDGRVDNIHGSNTLTARGKRMRRTTLDDNGYPNSWQALFPSGGWAKAHRQDSNCPNAWC